MTIRKVKQTTEQRIKRKARIKKVAEYIIVWVFIILTVAITMYPVQYLATKHCLEKLQDKQKTHATILIGGEKITLEDIDIIHIMEE